MRDPSRIDAVLAEVRRVWEKYPDYRLGQLLGNSVNLLVIDERGMTDAELARRILLIEESALLRGLEKLETRLDRVHSQQEE